MPNQKKPGAGSHSKDSAAIQSVKKYWLLLKELTMHPERFYANRKPQTEWKVMSMYVLPSAIVLALAAGLIQRNWVMGLAHFASAYLGLALLTVIERYIIMFFGEKRSFEETADLICTTAPALILGCIPQYGLPMALLLSGYWNYRGLVRQFKMDPNAALAAVGLPITLTGLTMFVLVLIIGPWIGAAQTFANQ
jgi:hypothetical protein